MPKFRPRPPTVLPLAIKNRVHTELPALLALTAVGETWFSSGHQADLLAVALVVGELAESGSPEAESAQRVQQLCAVPLAPEHKCELALNLAVCLPWLQLQQNGRIQRALTSVASRYLGQAA